MAKLKPVLHAEGKPENRKTCGIDELTNKRVNLEDEVAYSCIFCAVSDSSTCPEIGTRWCHCGIIEHFEIRGFNLK